MLLPALVSSAIGKMRTCGPSTVWPKSRPGPARPDSDRLSCVERTKKRPGPARPSAAPVKCLVTVDCATSVTLLPAIVEYLISLIAARRYTPSGSPACHGRAAARLLRILLANRTIGRAFGTVCQLSSVCLSVCRL